VPKIAANFAHLPHPIRTLSAPLSTPSGRSRTAARTGVGDARPRASGFVVLVQENLFAGERVAGPGSGELHLQTTLSERIATMADACSNVKGAVKAPLPFEIVSTGQPWFL